MSVLVASVLAKKLRNNQGIISVGTFFWPWNKLGQVQDPWIIPYSNGISIAYQIQAPRDMICLVPTILLQIGEELLEIWWVNQLPDSIFGMKHMHGQSFSDSVHQAILGRRA